MLPPRQTPHSTKAPGMPAATTYSVALHSACTRAGEVMVWDLSRVDTEDIEPTEEAEDVVTRIDVRVRPAEEGEKSPR